MTRYDLLGSHPTVRHAVGTQTLKQRHAHLQGMKPEQIGDHPVELRLLPSQHVLARRGIQPGIQAFDFYNPRIHETFTSPCLL